MNLYEAINANHVARPPFRVSDIHRMAENAILSIAVVGDQNIAVNATTMAILLAYNGNICQCLSQEDYNEFFEIVNRAKTNLEFKIRQGPVTSKLFNAVSSKF